MDSFPRRRIVCKIELGADSWQEAAAALDSIAFRLYEAKERNEQEVSVTSGGPSSGWTLKADEKPEITHESYISDIETCLALKKAGRNEQNPAQDEQEQASQQAVQESWTMPGVSGQPHLRRPQAQAGGR